MAAGWLTHLGAGQVEVRSAGSMPADRVNPAAVAAMAEVGIDIAAETPKIRAPGGGPTPRAGGAGRRGGGASAGRAAPGRGQPPRRRPGARLPKISVPKMPPSFVASQRWPPLLTALPTSQPFMSWMFSPIALMTWPLT